MNILGADDRVSAIQSGLKSQALRRLTASTVAASCLLLGFLVALGGYRGAMADKVLYGVSLGGKSYGGTTMSDLRTAVELRVTDIERMPLTIDQTKTQTSLQELGIAINTDQAVRDLISTGRKGSVGQQLVDSFTMLTSSQAVSWQFEASDKTIPTLYAALSGYVRESNDARFELGEDVVRVKPDVLGTTIDLPATIAQMETTYLRGVPTVLRVALVPSTATVTTADLEALQPQVTALIDQPVAIVVNGKHQSASRADVLSWIRPTRVANRVQLAVDDVSIAEWVERTTTSVAQGPVDRQVLASGTVVSEGRIGRAVDAKATAIDIKAALEAAERKPVIVLAVVKTVEPVTRVVAADTTAGLYDGKYVEVDLSSQMLYQYEGQTLIASYRVSTGKASTPTPTGTYTINGGKAPRAYSSSFGLYLPSWMPFIGSTYGLHALPEWPGGYREGENHLGIPVSHGCIRLSTANAATVYAWADVGTTVVIHR